jgi:hypothetical protein
MAKFLNLVETDGGIVRLTNAGRSAMLAPDDKLKEVLAKSLPDKYMTMFKWLKLAPDQQMHIWEMKAAYTKGFQDEKPSSIVLGRIVSTFVDYLEYLGLVEHIGKGQGSKIILTTFGKQLLDKPLHHVVEKQSVGSQPPQGGIPSKEVDKDLTHPITVISPGRQPFTYDIQSESDWKVVDSHIESIKEDYKKKANLRKGLTEE